ncbi:type 4 pilus major pilin [Pectobacterium fontis]|uniref:type 4 pilus major pilin n=1 Tax=Pectobacterium fontis TaxID=2558042 RepID=UPI0012B68B36|nr:type 4 pilus major pilin [Pectobacterium fontis]
MSFNKTKILCLLVVSGFSSQALSADSFFKAPIGSLYSLEYNSAYIGANVLKLTLSHVPDKSCATLATQLAGQYFEVLINSQYVPLTPPASGTTWNRNNVVTDKTTALCKSGKDNTIVVNHFVYPKTYTLYQSEGDIVHSSGGSSEKENIVNVSYEIYRKTMQTRENHQLSIK